MKHLFRVFRMARPYYPQLLIGTLATFAMTGVNLYIPSQLSGLVGRLTEHSIDFAHILQLALIICAVYVLRAVFSYLSNYFNHVAAWKLVSDIRVRMYEHYQRLSLAYFHDKQTGQLMSYTTNATATLELLIAHSIPSIVVNILLFLGVTIILLTVNPQLALLTFIPVPFLLVCSWVFVTKIRPMFRKVQSDLADLNAVLQDNFSGLREIQVFNKQCAEAQHVEQSSLTYTNDMLKALLYSAVFHPGVEFLTSLGTVIVVLFGSLFVLNMQMTATDIVEFFLYLSLFYQPLTALGRIVEDVQQSLAGCDRIFSVLDSEPDIVDAPDAISLPTGRGHIELKNVSFSYNEEIPVLNKISFTAEPGKMIAIVGATGVGKTTLINLLVRFYEPTGGEILIDGTDIRKLTLSSLRDQFSMVSQDIFLFNGTVLDNIAYGGEHASEKPDLKRVTEAAEIAQAHEFISAMPQGYDTQIGERGLKLSGGQKQRLAIARAVLRNKPILILDEATAAVDVQTEMRIKQAIDALVGQHTVIVIAHRLSTVKRADNIIVLHEGEIAESGRHEELFAKYGIYTELCKTQLSTNI